MIEIKKTGEVELDWETAHLYINGATDKTIYLQHEYWECEDPHKGIPKGLTEELCTAFPEETRAWIERDLQMAHGCLNNLQMSRKGNEFTLEIDYNIRTVDNGDVIDKILNPLRLLKLMHDLVLQHGIKITFTSWCLEDDYPGYFSMSHTVAAEDTIGQRLDELVEMFKPIEQEAMETLLQEARDLLNEN